MFSIAANIADFILSDNLEHAVWSSTSFMEQQNTFIAEK